MRLTLLLLALAAAPAFAETPSEVLDPDTCGAFAALDGPGRIAMLQGIEPFGDDIDPADTAAAEAWSNEVYEACAGHPDRPLSDAAATALGTP